MLHSYPDYYKEFSCIAGECEATCCAGWQIVVDEASLKEYEKVSGDFKERIQNGVDFSEGVFFQKEKKRCAFLNKDNLCDMYTALGEESLCETCKRYPRHIEEFENVREFTLSVSCPEVARILLSKKEPVQFVEIEVVAEEEEFEDFEPVLYEQLYAAREELIKILQNRKLALWQRMALCVRFAQEFQDTMDEGMLLTKESMQEHCSDEEWRQAVFEEHKAFLQETEENFKLQQSMFSLLRQLEFLSDDWEDTLVKTEQALYGQGAEHYYKTQREFTKWQREYLPQWDVMAEQLLVYFIYTYFCGAVYDEYVASKAKLAVISVCYIKMFLKAKWMEKEGTLSVQEIERIVYRYSRELEHSDENLCEMDRMLEEKRNI